MILDFPNNPTIGQTYGDYFRLWRYNGVAWDEVTLAEDSYKLWGIPGEYHNYRLGTGILRGGTLSGTLGGSTFNISAGSGLIYGLTYGSSLDEIPDGITAQDLNWTMDRVEWPDYKGITLTYLNTSQFSFIKIDKTGQIVQQTTEFTDQDYIDFIVIGNICHIDYASINLVTNQQNIYYDGPQRVEELLQVFGPMKKSGLFISGYTAGSLQVKRDSGDVFKIGSNYSTDPFEPDVTILPAANPSKLCRVYGNNTTGFTFDTNGGAFYTNIDATKYQDANGVLQTVNNNQWSIQRLFIFPNNPDDIICYYGVAQYNSFGDARDGYQTEIFNEAPITATNAVFLGLLFVRGGAADLTTTNDALFIQSGFSRTSSVGGGGGGGGGAISLSGLTDVSISGVTNSQVLAYESGLWVNRGLTYLGVNYFTQGVTAPTNPTIGDRWFNQNDGRIYTAILDNSGIIWVEF